MNIITYMQKIASSINITNPDAHNFIFGRGAIGGRMLQNPRQMLTDLVNKLNAEAGRNIYTVEATVKQLNDMQSGLGNRLNKTKPVVLYSGKEPIRRLKESNLQSKFNMRRDMGFPLTPAQKRRAFKVDKMLTPTPAEGSRMFKQHEMTHLNRFKSNPTGRAFSTKDADRGLRRLGSLINEEGRAYASELRTPNVRKRARIGRTTALPGNLMHSIRSASAEGSIRKEIGKGTLGRLARKIVSRGK